MSIITDALKKAESERELKSKPAVENLVAVAAAEEELLQERLVVDESKSVSPIPQESPAATSVWKYSAFLMMCTFFLTSLLIALIFFFHNKSAVTKAKLIRTSNIRYAKNPYVLSGISISGNDHYAIVNGVIVQKGDSVDGALIKEISDQEVILKKRLGEITLKIEP